MSFRIYNPTSVRKKTEENGFWHTEEVLYIRNLCVFFVNHYWHYLIFIIII